MSNTQTAIEPKRYVCRHIHTDGHRCRAKCLRGEQLCYFHHSSNRPSAHHQPEAVPNRKATFTLPLFEDRAAIQLSIYEIACRLANNQIDSRRAALLLYAMQIALQTHPRLLPAAPAVAADMVDEITLHPTLGQLAPESEFTIPKPEKTLEQICLEEWRKEP